MIVRLYDDGWRLAILLTAGRKYDTYLVYGTMKKLKVEKGTEAMPVDLTNKQRRRMIRTIKAKTRRYGQPTAAIKQALDVLKPPPKHHGLA